MKYSDTIIKGDFMGKSEEQTYTFGLDRQMPKHWFNSGLNVSLDNPWKWKTMEFNGKSPVAAPLRHTVTWQSHDVRGS